MEVQMSILPDIIVYIWLLPLAVFIVLPLSMLVVYLVGRLVHFMLFPKRMLEEDTAAVLHEGEPYKAR